ncbi:MAG: isoamylase early set domain-containing protein [Anaerolineae bacterium]|nr:isoamylase early set domain-containing protein [Anaerolineae bacterium]MCI0609170.1 isoamylase early set domain-containing protein [Anaerolineae bacterium]
MPKKVFDPASNTYEVTFTLPAEVHAETACLCADFNTWDKTAHPMKKMEDGSFQLVIRLNAGLRYHFRYFLDNERWANDWEADAYVPNEFGSGDSVLNLEITKEN